MEQMMMIPCSVELGTRPLCKLSLAVTFSCAVIPQPSYWSSIQTVLILGDGHCEQSWLNDAGGRNWQRNLFRSPLIIELSQKWWVGGTRVMQKGCWKCHDSYWEMNSLESAEESPILFLEYCDFGVILREVRLDSTVLIFLVQLIDQWEHAIAACDLCKVIMRTCQVWK